MFQDVVYGVDVRCCSGGLDGLVQIAPLEEVEGVGQVQVGHLSGGKSGGSCTRVI